MQNISKLFCLGLTLAAALTMSACSYNKKEDAVSGDVRVQIPVYAQGKYQLSIMELTSIVDLTHLAGAAAKFFVEPHVFRNQLRGSNPEIHYIKNSHDVIVPTDSDSLQLLTMYSQFEKLRALDKSLGVESANKWPVTVAVNVFTKDSRSGDVQENNAFYTGDFDAYLFAPYTNDQLPLMVNSGVLAHEHFHSLYQHLVIDPIKNKYPDPTRPSPHDDQARLAHMGLSAAGINEAAFDGDVVTTDLHVKYHALLLRGVNEGLADVWGWIFSGDEGFVGRSLRSEVYSRSLSMPVYQLENKEQLMNDIGAMNASTLGRRPYEIGTQLARTLKSLLQKHYAGASLSDLEIRQKAAALVIKALPLLRDRIAINSTKSDEYLSLSDIVGLLTSAQGDLTKDDCQWLTQLMPPNDVSASYHCGAAQ